MATFNPRCPGGCDPFSFDETPHEFDGSLEGFMKINRIQRWVKDPKTINIYQDLIHPEYLQRLGYSLYDIMVIFDDRVPYNRGFPHFHIGWTSEKVQGLITKEEIR